MTGGLCILIPTFEQYRDVAEFTRGKLDEYWPGHPPVFFCGFRGDEGRADILPLRVDPTDWLLRVRSAIEDLQGQGFQQCYLVLDDQPPVGRCHVAHLNETLPRLMNELGASYIGLHGWGQTRPPHGENMGPQYFHLERSKRDYLWKFALHPGLWNLHALTDIIDVLYQHPDPKEHTCWKFERRAGAADFALPAQWLDKAYRVCGTAMSARPMRCWRSALQKAEIFSFDVLRFFIRILGGQARRDRFDARFLGAYHYYDGPYPIFWSGVIKKGRLNPDLLFFYGLHGCSAQREELESRFKQFSCPATN